MANRSTVAKNSECVNWALIEVYLESFYYILFNFKKRESLIVVCFFFCLFVFLVTTIIILGAVHSFTGMDYRNGHLCVLW